MLMSADELLARLSATTDVIAARLNSLLTRVAALPGDSPAAVELRADAESLRPMVAVLEGMGRDPDNPVPPVAELPRAELPAVTLAPVTLADGSPMPAVEAREAGR